METTRIYIGLFTLLAVGSVFGCTSDRVRAGTHGDAGSAEPDADGAVLLRPGSGVEIEVPAGAVANGVTLEAVIVSNAPAKAPSGMVIAGPVVAVKPHGTTFSKPITLRIPSSRGGHVFTLANDDDRTWEMVAGVANERGIHTFTVAHVSYFAELVSTVDAGTVDAGTVDAGTVRTDASSDATSPEGSVPIVESGAEAGRRECPTVPPTLAPGFEALPPDFIPSAMTSDGATLLGAHVLDLAKGQMRTARWTKTRGVEEISDANGFFDSGGAMNCDGSVMVLGRSSGKAFTAGDAFRLSPAGTVKLPILSELPTSGVNAIPMTGTPLVGSCQGFSTETRPCQWLGDGARLSDIGGIAEGFGTAVSADGTVIAGTYYDADRNFLVYRWTAATGVVELGPAGGSTVLLSADGRTVAAPVNFGSTGYGTTAVWTVGSTKPVYPFGNVPYSPIAVNGDGSVVVGLRQDGQGGTSVWDVAHGVRDFTAVAAAAGIGLGDYTLNVQLMTPDARVFVVREYRSQTDMPTLLVVLPGGTFGG